MPTLAADFSFARPNPTAIRRAGYSGVVRYLSSDARKTVGKAEVAAYHAAGLWIALVFENGATRPLEGARAGATDREVAEAQAQQLGYPALCPIFYACDFDADPRKVLAYYQGIASGNHWPVGEYGSGAVIATVSANVRGTYGWQAGGSTGWRGNGAVNRSAYLFQRRTPTLTIAGASRGAWDENVMLRPFTVWRPHAAAPSQPTQPLTPAEQHELLADVRAIRAHLEA